jgi:hypothetical protein
MTMRMAKNLFCPDPAHRVASNLWKIDLPEFDKIVDPYRVLSSP